MWGAEDQASPNVHFEFHLRAQLYIIVPETDLLALFDSLLSLAQNPAFTRRWYLTRVRSTSLESVGPTIQAMRQ